MKAMLDYAQEAQSREQNPNCRVLLSAVGEGVARFYEAKLGFTTLALGPLPDGEQLMMKDIVGPGLPSREGSP